MGTILRRRSFLPSLDGVKLEERLVLSTATLVQPEVSIAVAVDPLVPTNHGSIKTSSVQAAPAQLHAAFQTFINQLNKASQNAVKALGNGQSDATALASLRAYTSLQGSNLEAKVEQASRRLPGGVQYLFNPPQGPIPIPPGSNNLGFTTDFMTGPDLRYYVPPSARLKTQIDTMIAKLNDPQFTTLQAALGQNPSLIILQTYQSSKTAMVQYINAATTNGDFSIVRG